MASFLTRTFTDETIELDGHRFRDCVFVRCEVRFAATAPVELLGCRFIECVWTFAGASALTLQFLDALQRGGGANVAEAAVRFVSASDSVSLSVSDSASVERREDAVVELASAKT